MEIWRNIKGINSAYFVSNMGHFKSVRNGKERILKQFLNHKGYYLVNWYDNDGKKHGTGIHTLVAKAFIPNPDNLPEVDHIDNDKSNNCVENLQWLSTRDNIQKAWKQGKKHMLGKDCVFSKLVGQYDMNGNLIAVYHGSNEASRKTGILSGTIRHACETNVKKSRSGYIWKYL